MEKGLKQYGQGWKRVNFFNFVQTYFMDGPYVKSTWLEQMA